MPLIVDTCNLSTDDRLKMYPSPHQSARLPNLEMLKALSYLLSHLLSKQNCNILHLVGRFICLFNNVSSQTTVLQYDTDINDARPIKQHTYCV